MKKVTKVLMYVWRRRGDTKEFLALHRAEQRDCVVLTGHVGDVVSDESLKAAVKREIMEELGVEPEKIIDLKLKLRVKIKDKGILSSEHAFLVEISTSEEVRFLEYEADLGWYSLENLTTVLTYPNQKKPIMKIKQIL